MGDILASCEQTLDQISHILGQDFLNQLEMLKLRAERVVDKLDYDAVPVSFNEKRSPSKASLINSNISLMKEEIQEQLRSSFIHLERSNHGDLYNEL